MITRFIALATCAVLSYSSAHAGKAPAPAPNISASINMQLQQATEQLPPSVPVMDASIKLQIKHSFNITPEQEAALQPDAEISFGGMSFVLNEDSKFQSGGKSVTIVKPLTTFSFPGPVDAIFKAKWNKGKMTVSLSAKGKVKNQLVSPLQGLVKDEILSKVSANNPRAIVTILIETGLQHSSIGSVSIGGMLAAQVNQTLKQSITAEGVAGNEEIMAVKSGNFIIP